MAVFQRVLSTLDQACLYLLLQVFVRGLLDKLKVQPEVFRREEYKAALAPLMGTGFDPAHRENVTSLLKV
jgi:hypothetical protein